MSIGVSQLVLDGMFQVAPCNLTSDSTLILFRASISSPEV